MAYIASFDIGTTNVKGILVSETGEMAYPAERPLEVLQRESRIEQNPEDWSEAVFSILHEWYGQGVQAAEIALVSLCGQMQDLICVDATLRPVRRAILYSDGRAGEEAEEILNKMGRGFVDELTGNPFNGTLVLPKILWLKRHEPESYENTEKMLFSAKDIVAAKLTGRPATDFTTASTVGCMDLNQGTWSQELMDAFGIRPSLFPDILAPGEAAGTVHEQGAELSGLLPGTPVLCGFGDAGASTLGAGVHAPGQAYLYLGTTGWAAAASEQRISTVTGAFNLAFHRPGLFVPIAPLLNVGNVHRWAADTFADGDYGALDALAAEGLAKPNSLLFLPYLNGERCPVQDPGASGSFVGIRQHTGKAELAAAVLEGISFSLQLVLDLLLDGKDAAGGITAIGGGTRSAVWCQLLADLLQRDIAVPDESPYLPALGAAMAGFVKLGWEPDLPQASERLLGRLPRRIYYPNQDKAAVYREKYEKFKRLYPVLQRLWNEHEKGG